MSEQDVPSNKLKNINREGLIVSDAIHERFRRKDTIMDDSNQLYIWCDDCNSRIPWNDAAIKNHFNKLHFSRNHCSYCKGKVFIYRRITVVNGNETSKDIVYHKCDEQT